MTSTILADPAELVSPEREPDWLARHQAARSEKLTRNGGRELVEDSDYRLRVAVAQRPDLSMVLVGRLAFDAHPEVRAAIAQRRDLPEDLVADLAHDDSSLVRTAVAGREDLDAALLDRLMADDSSRVRSVACSRSGAGQGRGEHSTVAHFPTSEPDFGQTPRRRAA